MCLTTVAFTIDRSYVWQQNFGVKFSRKAYSVVSVLLLVEILAQFYFIAGALFTIWLAPDEEKSIAKAVPSAMPYAALHDINGTLVIPVTILILIGLSFAARYPWRTTGLTAVLFGLMVLQAILAFVGFGGLWFVAGLHPINGLVILAFAGWTVRRNWAFGDSAGLATQGAAR